MKVKLKLVVFFLILMVMPGLSLAQGTTARALLPQAVEKAKAWNKDAVLTNLATLSVKADGTSDSWTYAFFSPSAKKFLSVSQTGEKLEVLKLPYGLKKPVGEKFIDSNQAMEVAKKNGAKEDSLSMGLAVFGSKEIAWSVNSGYNSGDLSIFINATTGKFLRKNVLP